MSTQVVAMLMMTHLETEEMDQTKFLLQEVLLFVYLVVVIHLVIMNNLEIVVQLMIVIPLMMVMVEDLQIEIGMDP